jgi:hypothetical protein
MAHSKREGLMQKLSNAAVLRIRKAIAMPKPDPKPAQAQPIKRS